MKDVDLSLLLARQAVELDESPETLANLEASLVRAPDAIRFVRPLPGRLLGPAVVSDDGKLVSVGNNGGQVAFLDAFTGRVLRTAKADGAGFFPGGHRAWIGRGFPVVELAALDLQSGKETPIAKVEAPETAAAFSISQDLETWATLDESGRLELRDVHSNRVLQTETIPGGRVPVDVRFQGPHLAVLSGDPELGFGGPLFVDVWRVDPWAKRGSIEDPGPGVAVAVDPSGSSVVVGRDDGSLAVHDLRAGSSRLLSGRHSSRVNDASYSRDGKLIGSAGDDGQAIVWDAATGEPLHILEAHSAKIFGPAFDPAGKTVYTDGLDGALVAWDLTGSRLLGRSFSMRPVDPPGSVPDFYRDETNSYSAASPDGRRLAVVEDATKLAVYDLASGGRLFATPAQKEPVTAVTWSPDGREIATGAIGGELRIWSGRDGSPVERTFAGTPAAFPPGLDVPPDATNDLHAIAYSPDSTRIAAALSDGRVLVWDAATGKRSRAPLDDGRQGGSALDLAWSPDGGMLAAALGRPGEGIVWRMPEGKELYRVNIDDGYGRGSAVAFSPDGRVLATGGGSGEIKLWDSRTGTQSGASLTGTSGWVLSLGFDPTSNRAISTGTDGVARLWDVARRAPFGAPLPGIGGEDGSLADILSDGRHLVVSSPTGRAWVWPLEADVWKDRACAVAGRTLTEREWELYLPGEPYDPACD